MQQLKALGGTRAPSQVSLDTDEVPDEVRRRIQADLRLHRAFDSTAVPAVWRDPRSGNQIVVSRFPLPPLTVLMRP